MSEIRLHGAQTQAETAYSDFSFTERTPVVPAPVVQVIRIWDEFVM